MNQKDPFQNPNKIIQQISNKIQVSQLHSNQLQQGNKQIQQQLVYQRIIPTQRTNINVQQRVNPQFKQQQLQRFNNFQHIQQHQPIYYPQSQPTCYHQSQLVQQSSQRINEQDNFEEQQALDQYYEKQQLEWIDELQKGFDDDELTEPNQLNLQQTAIDYDLNEKIQFEIKSSYKNVSLLNTQSQYLIGNVSIKIKEPANDINRRVGVDLIFVIDNSSSMKGTNIQMIKDSLKTFLQLLGDNDRLQLITFNDFTKRLTPLKRVTKQNKIYFNQIISKIQADGANRIQDAIDMVIQQLIRRQYRNNVTSIFLLSNECYESPETQAIGIIDTFKQLNQDWRLPRLEQLKSINEVFTLNMFCFKESQDAVFLKSICNLKNGSFYVIQNLALLDEFFADALGGLISVAYKELDIIISSQAPAPYQGIQISKTYGNMWQKKGNSYNISQPLLTSGSRKDYVFELLLPKFEGRVQDYQRNIVALSAELKMKDPISGSIINKKANLVLTLFGTDEQITQNINPDIDVYAQYFRVKVAEVIDQAIKACESNKNKNAEKLINDMLIQIQQNNYVAVKCQGIIQDLQQAKQASGKKFYYLFGEKQMCQIVYNNYQQAGVNSIFSASGVQLQQPVPASYQNLVQQQMMAQAQKQKATQKKK